LAAPGPAPFVRRPISASLLSAAASKFHPLVTTRPAPCDLRPFAGPPLSPDQAPELPKIGHGASPPRTGPPTIARAPLPRRDSGAPAVKEDRFVRDEVLIELRPNVSLETTDDIARREQLQLVASQRLELIHTTVLRYKIKSTRPVAAVIAALETDPRIAAAQPNYLFSLQEEKIGGLAQKQYSGSTLHLDEAHAISKGAKALVGVIDTEVDRAAGAISDSFDALGADPELDDANNTSTYENSLVMSLTLAPQPDAHGTAIVGIIAGHTQLTRRKHTFLQSGLRPTRRYGWRARHDL
jgi:fervidolysin-like protein